MLENSQEASVSTECRLRSETGGKSIISNFRRSLRSLFILCVGLSIGGGVGAVIGGKIILSSAQERLDEIADSMRPTLRPLILKSDIGAEACVADLRGETANCIRIIFIENGKLVEPYRIFLPEETQQLNENGQGKKLEVQSNNHSRLFTQI